MNNNNNILFVLLLQGLYTAKKDFLVVNKTKVTGVGFTRIYYSFFIIKKNNVSFSVFVKFTSSLWVKIVSTPDLVISNKKERKKEKCEFQMFKYTVPTVLFLDKTPVIFYNIHWF